MTILVTGGTGFIGSHTVIALANTGYDVVILDNLCNSSANILPRLTQITGKEFTFYQGDIRNRGLLKEIFSAHKIDTVMHFAGLKAVGESTEKPALYYDNNVNGSLVLAEEMAEAGVFNIVFSSSATVYGNPGRVPYTEDMPVGGTTNPYGTSKYMTERILADIQKADSRWSVILLRYFNPIGAHESGLIGEMPNGIPNNLLPYVCQVAVGKLPYLSVFGDDYPTPDGTGIRDYIHVMDLANAHTKALNYLMNHSDSLPFNAFNLGIGKGHSVLEMIHSFELLSGVKLNYKIGPRRPGDAESIYADNTKAIQVLDWKPTRNLEMILESAWNWEKNRIS